MTKFKLKLLENIFTRINGLSTTINPLPTLLHQNLNLEDAQLLAGMHWDCNRKSLAYSPDKSKEEWWMSLTQRVLAR